MTLVGLLLLGPAAAALALVAWNVAAWPRLRPAERGGEGAVAVLIPARNEEARLPGCLDSAVAQAGETVSAIRVYDDHSEDATAGVVAAYAARDPRVRPVEAVPLPPGWCGKPFACDRLAAAADAPWLLFLDADARLQPGAVAAMVGEARRRRVTLLSCWPGLELVGFWERLLMPLLNFSVFTAFPAPLSLRRQDPALGLAHGACILVETEAYRALGGHGAVRNELFEDTELARRWRAHGHRGVCLDGQDLVRVRMYGSLGEIWKGFQKNFYPAFRRQTSFWAFMGGHGAFFLAPFILAPACLLAGTVSWPLWLAAGCALLARLLLAVRFGQPLGYVAAHPVAEAMLLALGLSSWWRCRTGRGVAWKGRQYRAVGGIDR